VSHDSGFLNNTITDVLHLNRFKLRRYRGNLEKFVQQVPEAKSYYTLEAAEDYRFKLPDPPLLEGVKTKEKSLLKMRKVGFQYPTSQVQQLHDITLQVSLSSRVAVLGPNGSGKSTLVKLLIGDMEQNKGGEIWKHPNLVIGYVAQHAFHHIDNHLDKTPLEYMLWRYQTGEDLEEMQKANRIITEEELQKMKDGAVVVVEGQKRLIDEVLARKKLKQSYEYEVSFKGLSSSENIWLPRDDLVKRGFEKVRTPPDSCRAEGYVLIGAAESHRGRHARGPAPGSAAPARAARDREAHGGLWPRARVCQPQHHARSLWRPEGQDRARRRDVAPPAHHVSRRAH
jgi:elongation factor 3